MWIGVFPQSPSSRSGSKESLQGISRCHPSDNTKKAEPMSMVTLEKVVDTGDKSTEELNFNTACKIAFAGFLRSGEFCYSASDLKDKYTFINTKLTRSDITFAADDSYAILRLKRSKSDIDHQGVDIILAATNKPCCPVTALKTYLNLTPSLLLLHSLDFKEALATTIPSFQSLEIACGHSNSLTGTNSLGIASDGAPPNTQHASDNGMLGYDIQRLGRWSSDAFKLYFEENLLNRYVLNWRFLTGSTPAIRQYGSP